MIIDNKIERILTGPSIFLGITFFFLGSAFIINGDWMLGIPFLLVACFLLFTFSGVEINTDKQQIKTYYKIFGLIKRGKWISLNKFKGVTLVHMKKTQTTFSRSNRQTSTTNKYFQIYLVNKANKPELPIKRCKVLEEAQNNLDEFSIWLKIPVFSIIE
ncbi:MAG: hypothetical protein HN778_11560 [Prolixibacteraceae bacterium]|nr:hypothetical protein [Prolixibacteraceae bacterium]MBT6005250.1 hypothetical protein [Prolixibacteraceae bacterium]MBT6763768.1 hypothetical protein [Prolixibacteraceae bacterium]MBT6996862.1 hypothetical protein [Prolixibacteraceae bacterium]MBT7395461.1 hypothetical protein [Prolixibacteraceae bacterium]